MVLQLVSYGKLASRSNTLRDSYNHLLIRFWMLNLQLHTRVNPRWNLNVKDFGLLGRSLLLIVRRR